ncbi:MAG: branched-chain amino acid transport system ATP-binding protein [Nocardioidaceae bacterium]|nr:branched-chain amino acid transport system ATP-binding protein [Nocardioidaceae bacterium]
MSDGVLRVRGLTRRFGGVVAVKDVELDIGSGERRAVLGPNGAGKSTLFNLIAGADTPTEGSIELFGSDVTHVGARQRTRMGLSRTFQTSRLLTGLTVEDNLYLAAIGVTGGRFRLLRTGRDRDARKRAGRAAETVGMSDRLDALAGDLSHGEQRQLEIALALVAEPRMLLLDEPAAGLSRAERQLLTSLLLSLDPDVTMLLIEHDMDVALTVAERVTMMHDGAVIVEGTPAEIRGNSLVHDLYLGRAHA